MAKMTTILLRLEPDLLVQIDKLRGEVPRASYIRNRLSDVVGGRAQSAPPKVPSLSQFAQAPRVRGGYAGPPAALGKPPTGGSSVKSVPAPKITVQYGPTKRKPGDLSKGAKKS